jgi:DNA-binding phage protein
MFLDPSGRSTPVELAKWLAEVVGDRGPVFAADCLNMQAEIQRLAQVAGEASVALETIVARPSVATFRPQ